MDAVSVSYMPYPIAGKMMIGEVENSSTEWRSMSEPVRIFEVDESSRLPIWVQLRNRIIYLIRTGYFQPGEQLPSVRSLAAEAAINYNTVNKTYVNLEHDGYVVSVRGRGVFVSDVPGEEEQDLISVVDAIIEDSIKRCMSLGMPLDEVRLRMMDVSSKIQNENRDKSDKKRGIYERWQGHRKK